MKRLFQWIWPDNIDAAVAIAIAVVVSVYSFIGGKSQEHVLSSVLLVLALVAFGAGRDRFARQRQEKRLDEIINSQRTLPADRFFKSKSSEDEIIKSSHSTVAMIQETGSLVTEHAQSSIIDFLNRNGTLHLVVSTPSPIASANLAFRNENLQDGSSILKRIDLFHDQISYIALKVGNKAERITVRYSSYDPGYTLTISDGRHPSFTARAIVRLAGFRIPFARKLDFVFDSETSPRTISHFSEEFESFFKSCSKFILVLGAPRSGKTTIINRLISKYSDDHSSFFTIASREILENGERTGFEAVVTPGALAPRPFATRKTSASEAISAVSNYDFDNVVWDGISSELLSASIAGKIILLDEIGEMQISSDTFRKAVMSLLDDNTSSVIATISAASDHFLRMVRDHARTNTIELNESNRDFVWDLLESEVISSIRTTKNVKGRK